MGGFSGICEAMRPSVIFSELQHPTKDFSQKVVSGARAQMVAASKYLFFAIFPKKLSQRKSNAEQALRYNLFAVCVEDTLHHVYKDCHFHKYPTSPKVWEKSELLLYTWRHSSTVPPISCRSLSDWLVRELSLQNHCLRWTLATRSCSMSAFSPQTIQCINWTWINDRSMIIWLPGFPPARVNERRSTKVHENTQASGFRATSSLRLWMPWKIVLRWHQSSPRSSSAMM